MFHLDGDITVFSFLNGCHIKAARSQILALKKAEHSLSKNC